MYQVPKRSAAVAASLFFLLAIMHTWPLITGLNHLSRWNNDEWLNAWVVSWVAHQLPRDPLHLLDANSYFPESKALAYTEPLIVPGVMGAPLRWLGYSPLFTYNVLVLLGFTLTALAMYWLVVMWTGDHWAGFLAGALLAFSTAMLTRIPHLQILHFYWMPLGVIALERFLSRRRMCNAIWLGACVLGAALTSGYLVVFVVFALGACFIARVKCWWGRDSIKILAKLMIAAVVTLAILLVLLSPYQRARRSNPPRHEGARTVSAALESYLASAARLHYSTWSESYYESAPTPLFPGITMLALAGVAVGSRRVASRGARRLLIAIGVTGFILSLGALTPIYTWLYYAVPPLQGLRAPSRFGILVFFALAALAGFGLKVLREHWPARWRITTSVGLIVFAMLESIHAPIPYKRLEFDQPIYKYLANSSEPGALLEMPIYTSSSFQRNAFYLLASTIHWRPLVNGFGGFQSAEYVERGRLVGTFPSVVAVARLRNLGVKFVVVHLDSYRSSRAAKRRALARAVRLRDIELVAEDGLKRLYRIREAIPNKVSALLTNVAWSESSLVVPKSDGILIGIESLGLTFGVQGQGRLILYMEDTVSTSRLFLQVQESMVGEFMDAESGEALAQVSLQNTLEEHAQTLVVPTGKEAVILVLRER